MLEEGPLVCARPGLPQSWGVWEADRQSLQGNAPLRAPYHSAQQFHKTQRPNLENSWGGRPKRVVKRSSDKWTAQQDSTHAQAHCSAAITTG